MEERAASPLSRRQLIAATVSGALLGSAWATAFREATSQKDVPAVTVARNRSALAALIEHERKRLLLLDSPSAQSVRGLTELVTGFTTQRIDLLLATTETLAVLPGDFRDRWAISEVFAMPDSNQNPSISLNGSAVTVDELRVTADRIPTREWLQDIETGQSPWFLIARFRSSRIVFASAAHVIGRLPVDPGIVTCVICNDPEISILPGTFRAKVVAVPSEAELLAQLEEERSSTLIPLHSETPQTFRLSGVGIELPTTY